MKFSVKLFLFSVQVVLIFGDTPFDYCTLNENVCENKPHIACGTLESKLANHITIVKDRPNITTANLSDSEKAAIINFINAQRNNVALGQTLLPKGSNLPKTVWDDELELFAKSLVEIQPIADQDDFCFKRRSGQIVYSNLLIQENPKTVEDAVRDILENPIHKIDNEATIDSLKESAFLSKMGCYYSHVANQNDSQIFQGGLSCVLDYGMERKAVPELYAEGTPCSKCKNDVGCDSDFAGLCATVVPEVKLRDSPDFGK